MRGFASGAERGNGGIADAAVGAEVIGAVVALARKAEDNGGRAVLCRLAPQLREAMTNMGLHRLWMFYGTREEALEAVRGRG